MIESTGHKPSDDERRETAIRKCEAEINTKEPTKENTMQIVSRYDGRTLYECDADSMLDCVQQAVRSGASLDGASLDGARLDGASLNGASLNGRIVTRLPLSVGPIGSRDGYTVFWETKDGLFVQCGCFFGSLDEFAVKVKTTHGNNKHSSNYMVNE